MNANEKLKLYWQYTKLMIECQKIVHLLEEIEEEIEKKKRSCCVRKINRDRNTNGFYKVSYIPMKDWDNGQFYIFTRMSRDAFNVLLTLFAPLARKKYCAAIQPECRLAVLLLYLSQGVSIQAIAWKFKLGKETVRLIIYESADILWKALSSIYASQPNVTELRQISQDFWRLWDMPNCLGAVDGKHIAIRCPANSGSQYFNYKKFHSIVLLAACDAKYCFTYIDLGAYGSQSDGGIFQHSSFGKKVLSGSLQIPECKELPGTEVALPHFFVADSAFPLAQHVMRPYPGKRLTPEQETFNKRLSRARRTIENAFGILVARWRVLSTTLNMLPENAEKVVLACVVLHNYIMLHNETMSTYCPRNYIDWEDSSGEVHEGLWRTEMDVALPPLRPSENQNHYGGRMSSEMREKLSRFFCS